MVVFDVCVIDRDVEERGEKGEEREEREREREIHRLKIIFPYCKSC